MEESAADETSLRTYFINGQLTGGEVLDTADSDKEESLEDRPTSSMSAQLLGNEQPVPTVPDGEPDINMGSVDPIATAEPPPPASQSSTNHANDGIDPVTTPADNLGAPGRTAHPASETSELTDMDDEPAADVEPSSRPTDAVRRSERAPKPVPLFTSGSLLTSGAPPKKRTRGERGDVARTVPAGKVTEPAAKGTEPAAKVKQEDLYWPSMEEYWDRAVSISVLIIWQLVCSHRPL